MLLPVSEDEYHRERSIDEELDDDEIFAQDLDAIHLMSEKDSLDKEVEPIPYPIKESLSNIWALPSKKSAYDVIRTVPIGERSVLVDVLRTRLGSIRELSIAEIVALRFAKKLTSICLALAAIILKIFEITCLRMVFYHFSLPQIFLAFKIIYILIFKRIK